jgi:hypothetical protein
MQRNDGKKKFHQYQQNKTAINSTIVTVIKDFKNTRLQSNPKMDFGLSIKYISTIKNLGKFE